LARLDYEPVVRDSACTPESDRNAIPREQLSENEIIRLRSCKVTLPLDRRHNDGTLPAAIDLKFYGWRRRAVTSSRRTFVDSILKSARATPTLPRPLNQRLSERTSSLDSQKSLLMVIDAILVKVP